MATKYHLANHGPDICRVNESNPNSRGCPFGGASGKEDHFNSMAEAETAYERKMEETGNGLVANSMSQRTKPESEKTHLQKGLTESYQRNFEQMAANSYYGISKHPRHGGYIADSSQSLKRFCDKFSDNLDNEIEPEINYVEGTDDEVISSIYISELKLEIENQNAEDDMAIIEEYRDQRFQDNFTYMNS